MPLVVSGSLSEASSSSSAGVPVEPPMLETGDQDVTRAQRDPLRDLPDWLREVTHNSVDIKYLLDVVKRIFQNSIVQLLYKPVVQGNTT